MIIGLSKHQQPTTKLVALRLVAFRNTKKNGWFIWYSLFMFITAKMKIDIDHENWLGLDLVKTGYYI